MTEPSTVVVLDIDNTLTLPRQPIDKIMADALSKLKVPFHVAAGSHLPLLKAQFFDPLYAHGFRGGFDAYVGNGANRYAADFAEGPKLSEVSLFDIRAYLGERDYGFLIDCLERTLLLPDGSLPPTFTITDGQIAYRGSMVNFSPVGRQTEEDEAAQRNRARFVDFDTATGYRPRLMGLLRQELKPLVDKRQLTITLGGQTSFDIGVEGEDKSKAVRTLLAEGAAFVVFLGDALFEGGNDAPVLRLAKVEPARLRTIQVESCHDTLRNFRELGFLD